MSQIKCPKCGINSFDNTEICPTCKTILPINKNSQDTNSQTNNKVTLQKPSKPQNEESFSQDYIAFDNLIIPDLIQILYPIGAMIITGFFIYIFANSYHAPLDIFQMVVSIIMSNLLWRMLCEIWILFFSIHKNLVVAVKELKKLNEPKN